MNKALLFAAVGLAALTAAPAHADDAAQPWNDEVGQWFIMPFLGYTAPDNDRLLKDGPHYGASIGKHLTDRWTLQVTGYGGDFDNKRKRPEWTWPASFDGTLSGGSVDLLRVFNRDAKVSPYVLGAIGMQNSNYKGLQGDDSATLGAGAGVMWDLYRKDDGSRTVQLRPEVRARWNFQQGNDQLDMLAQVGLAFGWGAARATPAAEEPPPPPPPPAAPAKCGDEDNDGVCNEIDKCPGTPAGTKVDSVGCPLEQTLKLLFDFDSAELRPESITELERVVKFMNDVPFARALVQGHTDSVGSDAYNMKLSDRRAKSVFDYLTSRGVDPSRLTSEGRGETMPIADNATAAGRQENRRVMLIRTDSGS